MTVQLQLSPPLTNEAINALFSTGFPSWQTAPDTSDWQPILSRSLAYVGAFAGDRLVGFVNIAWDGRDHAFLLDTRVHPDHRHQGLGAALVARASEAARAAGCTWLHVDYTPELETFYVGACGFRPTPAALLALTA